MCTWHAHSHAWTCSYTRCLSTCVPQHGASCVLITDAQATTHAQTKACEHGITNGQHARGRSTLCLFEVFVFQHILTVFCKKVAGSLRPNFIALCQWDGSKCNSSFRDAMRYVAVCLCLSCECGLWTDRRCGLGRVRLASRHDVGTSTRLGV